MDILNTMQLNKCLSIEELGKILNKMYNSGKIGKMTAIHLFGIIFSDIIKLRDYNPDLIIESAGLKKSLSTELRKGISLAEWIPLDKEKIENLLK